MLIRDRSGAKVVRPTVVCFVNLSFAPLKNISHIEKQSRLGWQGLKPLLKGISYALCPDLLCPPYFPTLYFLTLSLHSFSLCLPTPSRSTGALAIDGERVSGQDVRTQNVTACMALANIVKSSLGPVGLDKMLVDSIGDVTITNDGATILKQLEVDHPAAKVLVELAELQDKEVGDGTTSVVILAAELLKRANELVRQKIHPTLIMSGYRLAVKEAVRYIKTHLTVSTEKMEREFLVSAASTAMSSKIIGSQNASFFSTLAVDAVLSVRRDDATTGEAKYPIK